MREILFRGKATDNGEWMYGYYRESPSGASAIAYGKYSDYVFVQPETVGQYTGIRDENGVKIFEGDILADDNRNIAIAEYCKTMFRLRRVDNNYTMTWNAAKRMRIIGNIFNITARNGKITPKAQWYIDNCCAFIPDKESEESENE